MELKNISKTENLNYPTLSSVSNNNFMKNVPHFSMLLSSMITTDSGNIRDLISIDPNQPMPPAIAGGFKVYSYNLIPPSIYVLSFIIAILSLIIIIKNKKKLRTLETASNNNTEKVDETQADKSIEIDKTKRKIKIYRLALVLSLFLIIANVLYRIFRYIWGW